MHLLVTLRIVGLLLVIFSATHIPPMLVSVIYLDNSLEPFFDSFAITLITGLVIWLPVKNHKKELRLRDGFFIVALFWTVLSVFGALPFLLSPQLKISLAGAVFETASGLTTTGATVITGLDQLPKSILYYRQQLQWLGGMGVIVLAVAILPMLGIGGMQLYRAETPGPMKDAKLTPRIAETAKALWYIYIVLSIACALGYWLAGMNVFDAIGHSFSTISTGGFSTYDASLAHYGNNTAIAVVGIVFMFLGGANFALHFVAWRQRSLRHYFTDSEFKTYLSILVFVSLSAALYLYFSKVIVDPFQALLHATFQTVSVATSTGLLTHDYPSWPVFPAVLILLSGFIGSCAGSTGGGIKAIRFLLLLKQGHRELLRAIHPSAVIAIKLNGKPVPERVIESVWGFVAAFAACFFLIMLALMLTGLDQVSAFAATAFTINNTGVGLGVVGANYAGITEFAKWVLTFSMLLGRLEVFTILVLFTPAFWRR
jgi:trk system potassium uptake protein TrkH